MLGLEYAVDTLSNALGNRMGTVWLVEQSALIEAPAGQHMMMRRLLLLKVQHVENETGCMPNLKQHITDQSGIQRCKNRHCSWFHITQWCTRMSQ